MANHREDERTVTLRYQGVDATLYVPDAEDYIQQKIWDEKSFYELELLEDVLLRTTPGGVAVDAGAYIGNHTVFFARHAGLRVVAFEPQRRAFALLEQNVLLNKLSDTVQCVRAGLGAEDGRAKIEVVDANNLGKTMLRRDHGNQHDTRIFALDRYEIEGKLSVLKVDVEGMEVEVLRGAVERLRQDRPLVYVEAQSPQALAEVERLLLRLDYVVIDRFNATPTYLFLPMEDERQRSLSVNKRMGEMYRDVRSLAEHVSSVPRAVTAGLTRSSAEIHSLASQVSTTSKAELEGLAQLERRLKALEGRLDGTVSVGTKQVDAVVEGLTRIEDELDGVRTDISDGRQGALAAEINRLKFINDRYRRKIEVLLASSSWRYTQPLRRLGGKKGMTAAEFFARVERQAPPIAPPRVMVKRSVRARRRVAARSATPVAEPARIDAGLARQNPVKVPDDLRVFAGMATIPERVDALEIVVASLLPQVDRLGVYLNGWDEVPPFLKHEKIVVARSQDNGDMGDAGKFFWVDGHEGVYFTCDDDIRYPSDYVARTLAKLRQYGFQAVVGWHGSVIKAPFHDYYNSECRRVFSFESGRPWDTPVHLLGTGCLAFHVSTIKVRHADFKEANMADVFFALLAQKQRVPLIVVEHAKGDLTAIESAQQSSINGDSRRNTGSEKNTRARQTSLVAEHPHWRTFEWSALRVLLIGRFERFQKGGIYKSCKIIASELQRRGNVVYAHDTEKPLTELPGEVDVAWIYPGDPERPDYLTVDEKVRYLQSRGIPVLVNFSYIGTSERSQWIAEQLAKFNDGSGRAPVFAAVFTESVADNPFLRPLQKYIMFVPKTIETDAEDSGVPFAEREGICFGDGTKLTNPQVIGGSIAPWIEACSRRLPGTRLYAYKQYSGEDAHPHLSFVPYMAEGFGDWLASRRLFVCLNRYSTFEMVACEAQRHGVPVIYRHMEHSLSEYVGPTGIRVRSPGELAEMCAYLYNDESAWTEFSRASRYNGAALDIANHGANLECSLRLVVGRAAALRTAGS